MDSIAALEALILWQPPWMKRNEPWFKHTDKLPPALKDKLAKLKSDDLRKLRIDYVKQWL